MQTKPNAEVTRQESSHTPGPWKIHFTSNQFDTAISGHEDVLIARVVRQDVQCDGSRSISTEQANAALIAAAPELLDCCVAMLQLHDCGSWGAPPGEYLPNLRAAIQKAKGAR